MKPGRKPKFKQGAIVTSVLHPGKMFVTVDRRTRLAKAEYRCIPVSGNRNRYGRAIWIQSHNLTGTGERSGTGSILTYRANENLDAELEGRGCKCQCCIHVAMPKSGFVVPTGRMKFDDSGQE